MQNLGHFCAVWLFLHFVIQFIFFALNWLFFCLLMQFSAYWLWYLSTICATLSNFCCLGYYMNHLALLFCSFHFVGPILHYFDLECILCIKYYLIKHFANFQHPTTLPWSYDGLKLTILIMWASRSSILCIFFEIHCPVFLHLHCRCWQLCHSHFTFIFTVFLSNNSVQRGFCQYAKLGIVFGTG